MKRIRTTFTLTSALGAALLSAGPGGGLARAQAQPPGPMAVQGDVSDVRARMKGITVSVDGYGIRPLDDDYDLFGSRDDARAGGLELSYEVVRRGSTRLALALGFLNERTAEAGNAGGELRLEADSMHAAAILRFRSESTFQPYLTVGGGLKRAELELTPRTSSTGSLEGRTRTGFGRASVGLRALPRAFIWKRPSGAPVLGLAVGFEMGGILGATQRFELAANSARPEGETPIPVAPVDAGRLGGHAVFTRFLFELVL